MALALLLAAPAGAARPITPKAPELPQDSGWINARSLSMSLLKGRKVVVIAFINPTALNSVRAVSALNAWWDRYALKDLMIVGVVTPAISPHRDAAWLRSELLRQKVDFPVVIDADRSVWTAYANEGWPALFLVDRKGRVVFDRLGEGGYGEFEDELRTALGDLIGERNLPPAVSHPEPKSKACGRATREVILGGRGSTRPRALDVQRIRRAVIIGEGREAEAAVWGAWDEEPDGVRLARFDKEQPPYIRTVYVGAQALATLSPPPAGPARFFVKQDEQWLQEGNAGRDVRFDDDGRSFIRVDRARLYDVARNSDDRFHELQFLPEKAGAGVFGFSFADACTVAEP